MSLIYAFHGTMTRPKITGFTLAVGVWVEFDGGGDGRVDEDLKKAGGCNVFR